MTQLARKSAWVAALLLLVLVGAACPEYVWLSAAGAMSPAGPGVPGPRAGRGVRRQLRPVARSVTQVALASVLRIPGGLRLVNRCHQSLSSAQKRRFFYLSADMSCRVEGPWIVDFGGRRLTLPLHRDFDLAWSAATAFHGYDPELHEFYQTLVQAPTRPSVFFDVGANYGLHSLKLLAHGVKVVSFEPNPACEPFFRECCGRNGLRPDWRSAAVGDRAGWVELRVPRGRPWLGTTAAEVADSWSADVDSETFRVPQVTLDDVVATDGIIPDVIKIDTEGTELAVLEGARGTLRDARPALVLESWAAPPQRQALFTLLTAHGYGLHALHFAAPPSIALTSVAFVESAATNFVAVHRSKNLS